MFNAIAQAVRYQTLIDQPEIHLDLKRLDLIHPHISGNKFFKLKYNLQHAKQLGQDTLITFGGAFLCVLGMNTMEDYVAGLKTFKLILKVPKNNVGVIVKQIVDLSNTARKEGLLALEESAEQIEDVFLKNIVK